jgi:hypothetical protein
VNTSIRIPASTHSSRAPLPLASTIVSEVTETASPKPRSGWLRAGDHMAAVRAMSASEAVAQIEVDAYVAY